MFSITLGIIVFLGFAMYAKMNEIIGAGVAFGTFASGLTTAYRVVSAYQREQEKR